MGLTSQSTGTGILEKELDIELSEMNNKVIALAGNPNVGKSTVFNSLTGLNQHTGNWPGKTVMNARGRYKYKNKNFILVDLPGTYSLMANSEEEEIARDFICFGNPDGTIIVTDATSLERNLNLVLQTLEITSTAVVCVNLMDEAKRKKINIDIQVLSDKLGVPVVATSARSGKGLNELMEALCDITDNNITTSPVQIKYDPIIEEVICILEPDLREISQNKMNVRWLALRLMEGDQSLLISLQKYLNYDFASDNLIQQKINEAREKIEMYGMDHNTLRDKIVFHIVKMAEQIGNATISYENKKYNHTDRKLDHILTSRIFGIPIMIGLLSIILWLTITGANYPSKVIAAFLFWIENRFTYFFIWTKTPPWVNGLLVMGIYRTLAWVVSVMLPPMAIFFPLFTLMEDFGYLPRVAFNLDNFFKKSSAHGKQALTMCMGFGCNAAGVIGCRIIDSPRERLIAIITNNFVPCNGRFPTLIAISTMFFAGVTAGLFQSAISALLLTGIIILGVYMTLLMSKLLSKTILKGLPSSFTLELPPYRKPQIGKVIIRSIFDRTLFVLVRAILVAAPAGSIIWLMANIYIGDSSILAYCADFLNPFAKILGLDGYILMAFILGFPANEIVVPIIIMSYMATGNLLELDNLNQLKELLISHGWTWITAVSTMLFSLMHWPCGTTCLTIKKETGSWKWTFVSFLVPTITGFLICFIFANTARLITLIQQ